MGHGRGELALTVRGLKGWISMGVLLWISDRVNLIGWTLVGFWIPHCWTLDFGFRLVGLVVVWWWCGGGDCGGWLKERNRG